MNSIETITHILYNAQIPYQFDQQHSLIGIMLKLKNEENIPISLQFRDGGQWLDICAPNLCSVKDSVFKGIVLQTLLTAAWELPIVRYFYHPDNGNISASIDLVLIDTTLTANNLIFCLTTLLNGLDDIVPRLRSVLATGKDPGRKSYLEQLIEQLPNESLEKMAQLIELRQQQS